VLRKDLFEFLSPVVVGELRGAEDRTVLRNRGKNEFDVTAERDF